MVLGEHHHHRLRIARDPLNAEYWVGYCLAGDWLIYIYLFTFTLLSFVFSQRWMHLVKRLHQQPWMANNSPHLVIHSASTATDWASTRALAHKPARRWAEPADTRTVLHRTCPKVVILQYGPPWALSLSLSLSLWVIWVTWESTGYKRTGALSGLRLQPASRKQVQHDLVNQGLKNILVKAISALLHHTITPSLLSK